MTSASSIERGVDVEELICLSESELVLRIARVEFTLFPITCAAVKGATSPVSGSMLPASNSSGYGRR